MIVGRTGKDTRKINEWYRDKDAIGPSPAGYSRYYLRECDVGVVQGSAPAQSVNNTVNSSYRPEAGSGSGSFEYTGVVNPWNVEIAGETTVFLARIWTGEWVIVSADCPT
jgi:hypothetical protein